MHSEFHAAVLGVIQGLTEFLPVSSSAHLTLTPWLFGWNDPGLAFDVALHMGSLLALLIYYRRDWLLIINGALSGDQRGRRLFVLLVAASVPGAILGFLFEKQAETVFRSPLLIAAALAVLGLALWVFDVAAPQWRDLDDIRLGDALLIGLEQAFALIHGVSRSGMTGELTAGFVASAVFSFAAIAVLIAYVRTRTYKVFVWYRLALAVLVVAIYLMRAG